MTLIPTHAYPVDQEVYFAYTTGGKSEVSSEHIDSVTLTITITDARGIHVLRMEDFIVTLLIDALAPVSKQPSKGGHVDVKVGTMKQLSMKLRTQIENYISLRWCL